MSLDFLNRFVIYSVGIYFAVLCLRYTAADIHINHKKENLITDITNKNGTLSVDISENVGPDLVRYENEAQVQIYLQNPANKTEDETIVYSITRIQNDGKYNWFTYATSKGSTREEVLQIKKEPNENDESVAVKGTYSYIGTDGVRNIIGYKADKNGYQPKVLFGTNVKIEEIPTLITADRVLDSDPKLDTKRIGGDVLCSLLGGGCK